MSSSNWNFQTILSLSWTETRTQCKILPPPLSTMLGGQDSLLKTETSIRSSPGLILAGKRLSHMERSEALGGTLGPYPCPGALRDATKVGGETCPDPAVLAPGQVLSETQAGLNPPARPSPLVVNGAPCCCPNCWLLTYSMLPTHCPGIAAVCKTRPFFRQPCLLSPEPHWASEFFHLLPPIHQCATFAPRPGNYVL